MLTTYSLDFSDSNVSTTVGDPRGWTNRYAAPEVLNSEARNRASDIWSLGCILVEILSKIAGYTLSEVKNYWKSTGSTNASFAFNREALCQWVPHIRSALQRQELPDELETDFTDLADAVHTSIGELCPYVLAMLEHDSKHRPTIDQVIDRLGDLKTLFPLNSPLHGMCCATEAFAMSYGPCFTSKAILSNSTIGHLYPSWTEDHTYILLESSGKPICFAPDWNAPKGTQEQCPFPWSIFEDINGLVFEQNWLLRWHLQYPIFPGFKGEQDDYRHPVSQLAAVASMKLVQLRHIIFTSRSCNLRLPSQVATDKTWHRRVVQIARIPVNLPKSEDHGKTFIMLSFAISKEHDLPFEQKEYVSWASQSLTYG